MPKVTFLPINATFEVSDGETILDVAINNDVPLQHACGGFCACTTCHVYIKAGHENKSSLSEMEEEEMDRLELLSDRQENSRLGCQTKVFEDITVEIVNRDDF